VGEGAVIRVPLPDLNEERRRDLTKVAHNYAEQARVAVRHIRRDGMDLLKKLEKDGDMSEDDSRLQSDLVQKATDASVNEIDNIVALKEREIMQV
jgi:ribosome recycling factor